MKILIPTSITLDEEKLGLEPGDTVRHYNPTEPIAEEDTDAEVLIAWANTADQLADSARRMKNVGLIQALLAGPDAVRHLCRCGSALEDRCGTCTRADPELRALLADVGAGDGRASLG